MSISLSQHFMRDFRSESSVWEYKDWQSKFQGCHCIVSYADQFVDIFKVHTPTLQILQFYNTSEHNFSIRNMEPSPPFQVSSVSTMIELVDPRVRLRNCKLLKRTVKKYQVWVTECVRSRFVSSLSSWQSITTTSIQLTLKVWVNHWRNFYFAFLKQHTSLQLS